VLDVLANFSSVVTAEENMYFLNFSGSSCAKIVASRFAHSGGATVAALGVL
jgi:hypothetical protein